MIVLFELIINSKYVSTALTDWSNSDYTEDHRKISEERS